MEIEINNWPLRRRAMISLLENPRQPLEFRPSLNRRAEKLANKLELNNHPLCAREIRLYLMGIKTDVQELMRLQNDNRI